MQLGERESCRFHSWIKIFDKLLIAVRGYSIMVVSVSPSLKNAYQKNHCDNINAVPDTRLFRPFLYDYSKMKNLFY